MEKPDRIKKITPMTINKGLFAHIVVTIGVAFFWFVFVKSTRPELNYFGLDEYYFLTFIIPALQKPGGGQKQMPLES